MTWRSDLFLALAAALLLPGSALAGDPEYAPGPQQIIDGERVEECGYASVGSYGVFPGELVCSLVLVAPDVVLTAAHCLDLGGHPTEVHFGETHAEPREVVDVEFCRAHPGWDNSWGDIGFCVLAEPVTDIPVTPIGTSCELEGLQIGGTLEIVGYGLDQDGSNPTGGGVKRRATQLIDDLVKPESQIWMLGMDGVSACFGDSGGPAMLHLPDGQTRVVGLGQMLREDAPLDPICGWGIIYQAVFPHIGWLEDQTGRDLTPCWDGGVWDPGPGCSDFAVEPWLENGTWAQGCVGGGLSGPAQLVCGDDSEPPPPPEPEPEPEPEPGDGDGDSSEPPPPPPPPPSTTGGSEDTGDDETGDDAGADWDPDRGCGCATDSRTAPPLSALALLGLLAFRRRRTR